MEISISYISPKYYNINTITQWMWMLNSSPLTVTCIYFLLFAISISFSVAFLSLQRHIEYYDKYGAELDKQLEEIQGRVYGEDDELKKQIDLDNHIDNEALTWYSFWTNTDI